MALLPTYFIDQLDDPIIPKIVESNLANFNKSFADKLPNPNSFIEIISFQHKPNSKPLLFIGGGPSARENADVLNDDQYQRVFTGGAVGLLKDADLTLPREDDLVFLSNPQSVYDQVMPQSLDGVTVLIASHCTPQTFEKVLETNADMVTFNGHIPSRTPDNIFNEDDITINIAYSALPTAIAFMVELFGHKKIATLGWDGGDMNNVDPIIAADLEEIHRTGNAYHYGNEPHELAMALDGIDNRLEQIMFFGDGDNQVLFKTLPGKWDSAVQSGITTQEKLARIPKP